MKPKSSLLLLLSMCFVHYGWALDYLEPSKEHRSPDSRWKVWVVKHATDEDTTARFHLSRVGDADSTLLCENARHFGTEWSPDSKTLLVYDNSGSGNSDVFVFRLTSDEWKRICQTSGGFHVIWRLAKWIPEGVQLHARAGGSEAELAPPFTITFDDQQKKSPK
jgi:hypothetical protein